MMSRRSLSTLSVTTKHHFSYSYPRRNNYYTSFRSLLKNQKTIKNNNVSCYFITNTKAIRQRQHYLSFSSLSSSSNNDNATTEEILNSCTNLYTLHLTKINDKIGGVAIPPVSDRTTSLPFCLLLGNHSSGKSSFINYILGRQVQKAGVAPTDDTFTVIAPGTDDIDSDGPTLVGNPDLGFASLRQFGPTLIHHTQLKQRSSQLNFMLVDSPGMIDAPSNYNNAFASSTNTASSSSTIISSNDNNNNNNNMDRGYDFPGVVRWFAQRADVVLLFFDPDKPGTTGETMSVLLHALSGMDHKLLIVLNKADQFSKLHDFARAYGSLCWNLSKVIPRKDLPPIFTMCLPTTTTTNQQQEQEYSSSSSRSIASSLKDLEHTRDDVVAQVLQAPKRRVDNVITNLYDSTSMLLLYSKVWNEICNNYRQEFWKCKQLEFGWLGLCTTGVVVVLPNYTPYYLDIMLQLQGGLIGAGIVGFGGLIWYHSYKLESIRRDLLTMESLSASFQRTHARQVQDADEFIASLWQRVREPLQLSLKNALQGRTNTTLFASWIVPMVSKQEMDQLNNILNVEIPKLRRQANTK